MKYLVRDNKGCDHYLSANDDNHVLEIMKERFFDYCNSLLSSDYIVVVRPNGYILAYINSATGEQTVKTMSDWGVN